MLDELPQFQDGARVSVRRGELDVPERRRAEPVAVGVVTCDVRAAEVVETAQTVAVARADLRDGDVVELLVGERRTVVALHASEREERLRTLELLRRERAVVTREKAIPRRIRERQLVDEECSD